MEWLEVGRPESGEKPIFGSPESEDRSPEKNQSLEVRSPESEEKPIFRLPTPVFRLPTPDSRLPTPDIFLIFRYPKAFL
jgi:hypothetical protein